MLAAKARYYRQRRIYPKEVLQFVKALVEHRQVLAAKAVVEHTRHRLQRLLATHQHRSAVNYTICFSFAFHITEPED